MRRIAILVTTVALGASAAFAQDPPVAPPAAPAVAPAEPSPPLEEPLPHTIALPAAAGGAAADVPTVLVAVGGFLVASTEPPDAMRVDGDRVWRTHDGAETLAALRLNAVGRGDDAGAGVTDAAARALLALDIDASRPDLAAWLGRIDPVRCAVRLRITDDRVVPKLPATLQLVEVVVESDGRTAGPEALPRFTSARRIALYGFDFSNAYDDAWNKVDEQREARFRARHAGAIVVTSPRPAFDAAVAGCDLVRVRVGGAKPRVIDLVKGDAAKAFVRGLEIESRGTFSGQRPAAWNARWPGQCLIEMVRGDRVVVRLVYGPSACIAWTDGPWPGVAALAFSAGRRFEDLLDDAGIRAPRELRRRTFGAFDRHLRDDRQGEILGWDAGRGQHAPENDAALAALVREPLTALRILGCSGGERDDRVTAAAIKSLSECSRDAVFAAIAPREDLAESAADDQSESYREELRKRVRMEDAELLVGFALWLWELPSRDFLTEGQRPLLERTARALAVARDVENRVVAVRACRELKLVEPLRRVLSWGRFDNVLPYPSQIQAAAALVDLGDTESLPDIRKLRDACEDPDATAALDAILARAAK